MFCIEGISLMWGCYIFFGQFSDWTADPEESTHFYCNAVICNNNSSVFGFLRKCVNFCEEFDLIFQTPYWPGFLLQLFRVVRKMDKKTRTSLYTYLYDD